MQLTLLLAPLLAASALAAPTNISTRQTRTLRVQLSNDATETGAQREIPANGKYYPCTSSCDTSADSLHHFLGMRISIRANFGNLGSPIRANRALIVGSGSGSCSIFSDAAATRKIATIV